MSRSRALLYGSAVLLVVAISIGGSLAWIAQNVVLIGRDAGGHLLDTLEQAHILREVSAHSLLQALSFNDYRPPAFYLFTQPFYALGGYSADVAQLQNVFWLAVILGLTFVYGWRFYGAWVALLALTIVAFLPMLASMTRMFYIESFVSAMVMLNLLALLQSQGFTKRGWSLLWGVSAGIGLLVKWTFPIYVLLPVGMVVWPLLRSRLPGLKWGTPQRFGRAAGISLLSSALLIALLMADSAPYVATLALGNLLFGIWFVLLALGLLLLQAQATPWRNLSASVLLLCLIASVWYLTRVEFVTALFDAAYGTYGGRRGQGIDLLDLRYYTRNGSYLWRMHLGPLLAMVMLPAALAGLLDLLRWRKMSPASRVLWGSVVSSWLFLTFMAQGNERNLVPLLPVLALLAAATLAHFPQPWRSGLAVTWVFCLALQWSTLTFDALESFSQATAPLWVEGEYAVRPASGATHPDFWIGPDVLARVAAEAPAGFPASLGMLINSREIHRGPLRYWVDLQDLPVTVRTLGEIEMQGVGEIFANSWVLFKDGDNRDLEAPGRAAVARLLAGDSLFHQLYTEAARYPLPNGETAWLYRRVGQNGHPYTDAEWIQSAAVVVDHLNRWWSPGAVLWIPNAELATWIGIGGLDDPWSGARIVVMEQGTSSDLPAPEAPAPEAPAPDSSGPVQFVVGSREAVVEEQVLGEGAVKALEVGDENLAVAVYGRRSPAARQQRVAAQRAGTRIDSVVAPPSVAAGQVMVVDLTLGGEWTAERRISLRLVDAAGNSIAQNDQVVGPTVTAGLFVPPGTAAGTYRLVGLLYDLPELQPLGEGEPTVDLMAVEVR